MQLKTYQQNALDQLDRWLDALKEARLKREKASKALEESGLDVPDASERGQMKIGKPPATFRMLFEERWQGQVSELLNETYRKGERWDC